MKRATPRFCLSALLVGCLTTARDERPLLGSCRFNDECAAPLVCAASRCRARCRTDRDCSNGWRCLSAGQPDTFACYAPDDLGNACLWDSHCRGGRVCGGDGVCRAQCLTDYDCAVIAPGLTCLASGVCSSHPFVDGGVLADVDLNARNDRPRPVDGGSADAGSADAGSADAGAWPSCAQRTGGCIPGVDAGCRVVEVAVQATTCALLSDGTVRCWGAGPARGTGSTEACPVPGLVPGLTGATQISVGTDFACARRTGMPTPIWCWGNDGWGQLGRGGAPVNAPQRAAPSPTLPDGPVSLSAAAGGYVVAAPGAWWAFGWNVHGTFGNGVVAMLAGTRPPPSEPVEVMAPGAVEVRGGQVHACARYDDGRVACWGRNDYGELGNGTTGMGASASPVFLPLVAEAQSLAVGSTHACALRRDRTVLCWGSGANGQLGRGTIVTASGPVAMIAGTSAVSDAEAIFLGVGSTCIRRAGAEVWCTGLGIPGEAGAVQTLRRVPSLDRARAVRIWNSRGCAIGDDDVLRCWGSTPGVLGVTQSAMPVPVTF
ncbi:MAG: hypothetical protein U0325_10375 [Polyangiales bacterium]